MAAHLQLAVNPSFGDIHHKADSFIQSDQTSFDLDDYLEVGSYSNQQENAFTQSAIIPYPEALSLKIRYNPYKMGHLGAIRRVWLSFGRTLYLWDYQTNDCFKYECDDDIQHVDLIDFNQQLELIVSTSNSLFSHTIQCQGNKLQILSSTATKTDGVFMSHIIATKDTKRVFMKGSEGHLYELIITFDQGLSVDARLTCHTENPLMCYLPSFFRSVPVSKVKTIAVGKNDILYVLQDDSTIHAVNIKGSLYAPMQRYSGSDLASIHTVPNTESTRLHLMAVSEKGDRLYFRYQHPDFILVHTRPAPPLPGSYLFNALSQEQAKTAFYQQGTFSAVLSKAGKEFLVWICSDAIDVNQQKNLIENTYVEPLMHPIWDIFQLDSTGSTSPYKRAHHCTEQSRTEYMTVSHIGLTRYTQCSPVDYLQQILQSSSHPVMQLLDFSQCYGHLETNCMAYVLACSPERRITEAVGYLSQSVRREEGLLLYFSRIVQNIWQEDITHQDSPLLPWTVAKSYLQQLLTTIQSTNICIQNNLLDLIARTIESISFLNFIYQLEWDQMKQTLKLKSINASITFADLVSTQDGAQLCQEIVLAAIRQSNLANATNQFSFIGGFLESNCQTLFGRDSVLYYKGLECLESARHYPEQASEAVEQALEHLQTIVELLDITTVNDLSTNMTLLDHHLPSIRLIFAKYQTVDTTSHDAIYSILLSVIEKIVQQGEQKARPILMETLKLTSDEAFHYRIYGWLYNHKQKHLLITLETPLLLNYIQTQILNLPERYACLKKYYTHRKQLELAIDSLFILATQVEQVTLINRVKLLQSACNELSLLPSNENTKRKSKEIQYAYKVAQIQLDIHTSLEEASDKVDDQTFKRITSSLLPPEELLEISYKYLLHEPALYLLHLLKRFDWGFVKLAWSGIINSYQDEALLKSKVIELASKLYPSISSFPVYIILQNLQEHLNPDFAFDTLFEAGVPTDVISDAKEAISSC
ncbi:Nup133 N terminal like-domain-containing protein [Blakeslea trispora]|nr:Nup133 N terminal like-domain-containing protein [Blakeslea trispora]